ncbi:hypothetical protein MP228_006398 [Amoeboaphelidium protococcarum]|nr:hypothetical protein MP228_006398 [Amoeboaphelidium protococcarum]
MRLLVTPEDISDKLNVIQCLIGDCKESAVFAHSPDYEKWFQVVQVGAGDETSVMVTPADYCISNGAVLTMFEVDPLFLLLSYCPKTRFMSLGDTECPPALIDAISLQNSALSAQFLAHLVDVSALDGQEFYRFNKDKAVAWLSSKVDNIVKYLQSLSEDQTELQNLAVGLDASDSDVLKMYALEMLQDYVGEDLLRLVKDGLQIKESCGIAPKVQINYFNYGRQNSNADSSQSSSVGDKDKSAKKQKTLGMRQLEKASKGLKSVASFFTKQEDRKK